MISGSGAADRPTRAARSGPAKERRDMQSSNSGFQRLSQTPLSRPRFLRLAASALLPFVGLRLSAAAAPNPQLAQNGRAVAKDYLV